MARSCIRQLSVYTPRLSVRMADKKDNPSAFQRTLNIYYHVLSSFISKMQTATKSDRLA